MCLELGRDLLEKGGHGDMQVGQNDMFLQAESNNFFNNCLMENV